MSTGTSKRRRNDDCSDSHKKRKNRRENSDEEWVEERFSQTRDDWMTRPLLSLPSHQHNKVKDANSKREKSVSSASEKPGQHPKELNPFWKDGGTGMPSESESNILPQSSFEGRSWLLRSYKRALEKASETNVSFEEIAIKRWGSVEKIHSLLRSAGIDPANPDDFPSRDKRTFLYSRSKYDEQCCSDQPKRHSSPISHSQKDISSSVKRVSKSFLRPGDEIETESYDDLLLDASSKPSWKVDQPLVTASEVEACSEHNISDEVSAKSPEEIFVTEAMINSVSAKVIKAELLGKKEKMKKYEHELQELRSKKMIQDSNPSQTKSASDKKTVLLTNTDRYGHVRPANFQGKSVHSGSHKGKSRKKTSTADDHSLKYIIEQERNLSADDTYEAIAKMASKFVRSTPEDVVDDVLDRNFQFDSSEKNELHVLKESRRMEEALDNCKYCVNSDHFNNHLLIAMGINTYLCVPAYQSLTEGHCLIVPVQHSACFLQLDENIQSEIKIFQKGLTRMFSDNDMDAIFTEYYTSSGRRSHMFIECIPVNKSEGSIAPMYFRKAILESDAEWAQNKKLIDTRSKELRKCVPLGLPYFFVDFNNEGGFAHVIEEASLFPHYFAKEVIGGLVDAEPRLWLKPQYESAQQQKLKVTKLSNLWKEYDWTKQLKN